MQKCSDNKEDVTNAILAFDTLYTTNHLKILKLLLPYLETKHQKNLALFIKWQELIFTIHFLRQYSVSLYDTDTKEKKNLNLKEILPLLLPYCNESEKTLLSQFSQMQNMMDMMEEMQQYMPIIQQFMSSMQETEGMSGFGNETMMDMLKNLISEEQLQQFFGGNYEY